MVVGIVLATIGIILTIILSQPIIDALRRWYARSACPKWSPNRQAEELEIPIRDEVAFEDWYQHASVDADGNVVVRIDCRVVNSGAQLLQQVRPAVFGECAEIPPTTLNAWARRGNKKLETQIHDWDSKTGRGRIAIRFDPPLSPNERQKIAWGFSIPNVYETGDDFFFWDISAKHYVFAGELRFHESWKITHVKWTCDDSARLKEPEIKNNAIVWHVRFPKVGARYRFDFGLTRSGKPV